MRIDQSSLLLCLHFSMKSNEQHWEFKISSLNKLELGISHVFKLNTESSGGRRVEADRGRQPGRGRGCSGEYEYVWGHHTHKHMLHVAIETSISSRRTDSFAFFSLAVFTTEASSFGKPEKSNEEFHSKMRDAKTEPPTLPIWFIPTLMQHLNHIDPFRL